MSTGERWQPPAFPGVVSGGMFPMHSHPNVQTMRALLLLLVLPLHLLGAQADAAPALATWISLDAPVGHEARTLRPLVPILNRATGGQWTEGALGSLLLRKGSGQPRRVVACGIDRPGFVVSQIRADGLLRLHTLGTSAHPLWEQAHEQNNWKRALQRAWRGRRARSCATH